MSVGMILPDVPMARAVTVAGADIRELHPPQDYPGVEQYKDWGLHVVEAVK